MAAARQRYRTMKPLLDNYNALAVLLLSMLLLLLLAGTVGLAYWMTATDDYRYYVRPPVRVVY